MPEKPKSPSWWQTIPGMLTAVAAVLTAVAGLVVAIRRDEQPKPSTAVVSKPSGANGESSPQASPRVDLSGRWSGYYNVYYLIAQRGDHLEISEYGPGDMLTAKGTGTLTGRQISLTFVAAEGPGDGLLDVSPDGRQISGAVTYRGSGRRVSVSLSR